MTNLIFFKKYKNYIQGLLSALNLILQAQNSFPPYKFDLVHISWKVSKDISSPNAIMKTKKKKKE